MGSGTPFLSQTVIKALNFHAIGCLHAHAGHYRPGQVYVGDYTPPKHFRVVSLMDDMVNRVNRFWTIMHPLDLAAYVLWRINWIHPFINGNGRTARAACYFVICAHAGSWLGGDPILPRLLQHDEYSPIYVQALKHADQTGELQPLISLISELLRIQFSDLMQP